MSLTGVRFSRGTLFIIEAQKSPDSTTGEGREIRGSSFQFVVPGSTDQRSDTTGRTEVATPTGLSAGALATLVSGNFRAWV